MNAKLYYSLVFGFFILSGLSHYGHWGTIAEFSLSAMAILFVASFLGKATESVAHYAGQRVGGFLNATFGNAAELIIAIFLVQSGQFDMVKASITGSIIGNLLLVLGLSVFLGGLKFKEQSFSVQLASHNSSLMILAVIALFVPAIFVRSAHFNASQLSTLSTVIAGALIVAYIAWLVFSMITHKDLLADSEETSADHGEEPAWSKQTSILMLVLATVMTAFVSEWLVHTLDSFTEQFQLSAIFVGAFLIAIVGNAAEHSAAIILAMKNKIGAAVEIAIGSSLQIALFVAPVLVFVSLLFGQQMNLVFTTIELASIGIAVFIASSISRDGRTNWYEGLLLIVVYVILGVAFFLV